MPDDQPRAGQEELRRYLAESASSRTWPVLANPPPMPSRFENPCAEISLSPLDAEPARIRGLTASLVTLDDMAFFPRNARDTAEEFRREYLGEFISDHHLGDGVPPVTLEDADLTAVSFLGGDRMEPICEMRPKQPKPEPVYPSRFERDDVV